MPAAITFFIQIFCADTFAMHFINLRHMWVTKVINQSEINKKVEKTLPKVQEKTLSKICLVGTWLSIKKVIIYPRIFIFPALFSYKTLGHFPLRETFLCWTTEFHLIIYPLYTAIQVSRWRVDFHDVKSN